ncbi:MAG: hypothetical protein WCO73_00405 [Verrucomicrobiota bacterium]
MKNILPIITLTTLAAAASAQSAVAPAGLSYNRVGLSYGFDTKNYGLTASALIGNSNVLIQGATTINSKAAPGSSNGADVASLGYVFKNAALGTDVIVSVGSNEVYGISFRRDLGNAFEGALGYSQANGAIKNIRTWTAEVAYNLNKQYALALGYSDSNATGVAGDSQLGLTVRYNF